MSYSPVHTEAEHKQDGIAPPESPHTGGQAPANLSRPGSTFLVRHNLTRGDLLGMSIGFLLCLVVSYALGHDRIFWEDEMLGWMVLTDPSFHHMITAWKLGADGGGFSFYLSCRMWFHIFGPSEASFRLYSATCFGLAFSVIWLTARRFYSREIVAFALFNTFFCSPPIVLHLVEGRFYGLFMLSVGLVIWVAVRTREVTTPLPARCYVCLFGAHALLVTSHLLGLVYSACIVLAMVVLDGMDRRWRPLVYASAVSSWLLLIPEFPAIRASALVGKPWFWTTPPNVSRWIGAYTAFSVEVAVVLTALLLLVAVSLFSDLQRWRIRLSTAFKTRRTIYLLTSALLLVPVSFLLEGFVGPSLFINRYLIPVAIGTVFLSAEAISLIDWSGFIPRGLTFSTTVRSGIRGTVATALAGMVLYWTIIHSPFYITSPRNYTDTLAAMFPAGASVLLDDAWMFTEVIARQHTSRVRFYYPLDWEQTTSNAAPRLEVTQYNLMSNWKKAGYFSQSIVDLKEFMAQNQAFFVVDRVALDTSVPRMIGDPLPSRFADTPGYLIRRIGTLNRDGLVANVWFVQHDTSQRAGTLSIR
jgi:hypothetical protein